MDLLNDEHSLWRDHVSAPEREFLKKVAAFAAEELAPNADKWEKNEQLPREIFTKAGAVGLMGVTAPEKLGGRGFGFAAYALAIRELARHCGAFALNVAAHNALAVGQTVMQGTPEQHRRIYPKLVNGEWVGAWALTEPEAGSDSAGIQTTAVERPDGAWELNGFKRYITLGRTADLLIVMAVSGTNDSGRKEMSAFLVDKSQITPMRKVPTCGVRASETSEFKLVGARGELLGPRGSGQSAALACLDKGRIGVAAFSLGLARAALDASLPHALSRKQFGKKLAEFQAIQFMLADCEVEMRASEALILHAAILASRGIRHSMESAVAKLYATEAASRICDRALQIHGGHGYTRDVPVERLWRDARIGTIGEGSSEVQRIVISRALLKSAGEVLGGTRQEA